MGDGMNSRDIENLSVDEVRKALTKTGFIDPCISDNDKEPFYDGSLYVYKNLNKTKDSLVGYAKAQVKGKTNIKHNKDGSVKYPIKITDLKAFEKSGVVFFVVSINKVKREAEQIFYSCLTPYRVKRILKNNTNKTSKNISFKPFPNDTDEIIEILINFIADKKRQYSFIDKDYTIEGLKEKGVLDSLSFQYIGVGKKKDAHSLLDGKDITIYAKIKNTDISVPVDFIEGFGISSSTYELDETVSVNNKEYYNKIILIIEKENYLIKVSDFLLVKYEASPNKKNNRLISFTLCGDLDQRIKQIEFLKDFVKYGEFKIGKRTIKEKLSQNNLKQLHYDDFDNYLKDFNDFKFVLNTLSVTKELDVSKCDQKEVNNLRALVKGIKLNEPITINDNIHPISYIKVADISLLLAFQQFEEDKYKIINFFGEKLDFVAGDNKEPVSQFVILTEKDFLKADNINYEFITNDIASCQKSKTYMVNLNNLLLEMLKAYDKKQSNDLLSLINSVDNILINEPQLFDNEIAKINDINTICIRYYMIFYYIFFQNQSKLLSMLLMLFDFEIFLY